MGESVGPMTLDSLIDAILSGKVEHDTFVRQAQSDRWVCAGDVKGLMERAAAKAVQIQQREQSERQQEMAEEARRQQQVLADRERFARLTISTSMPPAGCQFAVIDTIFALDADGERGVGIFGGQDGDANVAFGRVKEQLKRRAYELGADAVIGCQFEYRVARAGEASSARQCIEIFAYGTAIRFTRPESTT